MNFLSWHPHLAPLVTGLVFLALLGWLWFLYGRYRAHHLARTTWFLLTPKAIVAALLFLALLDPAWRASRPRSDGDKVLVLVDASSSMDVRDSTEGTRAARAQDLLDRLESRLGALVNFDVQAFDTDVHEVDAPKAKGVRGTDLGKVLAGLAQRGDLSAYQAVVLLTDGGDEPVHAARLPGVPLFVAGVGTDPSTWNDVALADVDAPAAVEERMPFEVTADVIARSADSEFAAGLKSVPVTLKEQVGPAWQAVASQTVDLRAARARVSFRVPSQKDVASRNFRLEVAPVPGELSTLNNERSFTVDVRKKSFYVLLFSRKLDWDFALLRRELQQDPAIKITALFRTGEKLLRVEGDRQEGDAALATGLPADVKTLNLYKCIIVGSFPADDLDVPRQEALRKYVEGGGSVVFLGGPDSFGRGGYDSTPLAPLIPWHMSRAEGEIMTGRFPVMVPPHATDHAAMTAVAKTLKQARSPVLFSVNPVGKPRTGAVSLLDVSVGELSVPVIALQRYGSGQTLGIATNTLWRWGRMEGEVRQAYHQFWQHAVRYLSGVYEGNRFLIVKWDRDSYRPSEAAEATLQVIGRSAQGQLRFTGSVTHGKETLKLPIEPVPGSEGAYRTKVFFPDRGEYLVRLEALAGFERVDAYERTFRVAPTRNEGARLEVDHAFLDDLAGRSGGAYAPEEDFHRLIDRLRARLLTGSVETDVRLVEAGAGFFMVLLLVLTAEWAVRRWLNLF
jgi:uncharacterized membrane protein